METQQKSILIEELDDEENWSLYPLEDNDKFSSLRESIYSIGILHPPLIQKISGAGYKVINGRRRVQIARELDFDAIQCHILDENNPVSYTLKLHLAEQEFSNPLSIIEQAYFVQLCKYHIRENDILLDLLPTLGFSSKLSTINKLLEFLQLEKALQLLLHNHIISEKTATTFLKLNSEDRLLLGSLFDELGIGKGKQHRLLILCHDLSRRLNRSIKEIFSDVQIKNILQHQEMSAPQKTSRILEILQILHSPELFKAEKDFQNRVNRINLPGNCSLLHSPAFEKDEVTLEIKFKDLERCVKTLETIRHSI